MTRHQKIRELVSTINLLTDKVEKEQRMFFKPPKDEEEFMYNMSTESNIRGIRYEIRFLKILLEELKIEK